MNNVADMPEDWWSWTGDELIPLGICEDFMEATDKADATGRNYVWLHSRNSLTILQEQINKELK